MQVHCNYCTATIDRTRPAIIHLDNLTTGVTAELIIDTDGLSLLGIRMSWTIKSVYLNCSFSSMRVELISVVTRLQRDITVNDTSTEFYDTICNSLYSPRVTAIYSQILIENFGNKLFYGGINIIM